MKEFAGGCFSGLLLMLMAFAVLLHTHTDDLKDERVNKICIEAHYKKYQLDMCDRYSRQQYVMENIK